MHVRSRGWRWRRIITERWTILRMLTFPPRGGKRITMHDARLLLWYSRLYWRGRWYEDDADDQP